MLDLSRKRDMTPRESLDLSAMVQTVGLDPVLTKIRQHVQIALDETMAEWPDINVERGFQLRLLSSRLGDAIGIARGVL